MRRPLSEAPVVSVPAPPTSADWAAVRSWRVRMRQYLIGARLGRAAEERAAAGERVRMRLQEQVDLAAYATIGIYWPVRGEIDVRDLALANFITASTISAAMYLRPSISLRWLVVTTI